MITEISLRRKKWFHSIRKVRWLGKKRVWVERRRKGSKTEKKRLSRYFLIDCNKVNEIRAEERVVVENKLICKKMAASKKLMLSSHSEFGFIISEEDRIHRASPRFLVFDKSLKVRSQESCLTISPMRKKSSKVGWKNHSIYKIYK